MKYAFRVQISNCWIIVLLWSLLKGDARLLMTGLVTRYYYYYYYSYFDLHAN